jgi:hypothetical protein
MYDKDDRLGDLPCIPKWFKFPDADNSPFVISLMDCAFDKWQNSIVVKCVQLFIPLLCLSL